MVKNILSKEKVNQGRASSMVKGSPFCSSPWNLPLAGNFNSGFFGKKGSKQRKVNQGRASNKVNGSPFCSSPGNFPLAGNLRKVFCER